MIKRKIEECIRLTELILTEYFSQGIHQETLQKHLYNNCLWIGSIASEYVRGKQAILKTIYRESRQLPLFVLTSKEFDCVDQDRKMAIISGRYIGCTVEGNHETYRDVQRITFVWKERGSNLWLTHFHISNPMKTNEIPNQDLSVFKNIFIDALQESNTTQFLSIKDENNAYQKILLTQIVYIEAFDKNCVVHLKDRDILAKASIREMEDQIGESPSAFILRVHKSFMVNKFYVNSLKRYELLVARKYKIPISRGNFEELKQKILFIRECE